MHFIPNIMTLGNGGTVTVNNVQGNGAGQWVAVYAANGDSSYRNMTITFAPSLSLSLLVKF